MNIAILISGHIRDCFVDNIKQNIIEPLKSEGYTVDIFVSTWSLNERRNGGTMYVADKISTNKESNISNLSPVKIETEQNNRPYFLENYKSVILHQHMSEETCGDATSQLYKLYKCKELMVEYSKTNNKQYDIIIR